jgi:hypothetical protein
LRDLFVHLTISIPEAQLIEAPAVLRLIRMATACEVEADERGPLYVALFDDFPQSVDLVARLIEAADDLRDVCITVDARPVVSRTKFYNTLLCYRDSLMASDPSAYCAGKAARIGDAGGCPDRACVSHCQFICTRCFQVTREQGMAPVMDQLRAIAVQAEVDWCPNLRRRISAVSR